RIVSMGGRRAPIEIVIMIDSLRAIGGHDLVRGSRSPQYFPLRRVDREVNLIDFVTSVISVTPIRCRIQSIGQSIGRKPIPCVDPSAESSRYSRVWSNGREITARDMAPFPSTHGLAPGRPCSTRG